MKIALVNDYQERVGGTEEYLYSLADALQKHGHEVVFYFGSNKYQQSVQQRKSLGGFLQRIFNWGHWWKFSRFIQKEKPDVIHLQNIFNELSPAILLATGSRPVIMTLHDYQIVRAVFTSSNPDGTPCAKEVCPGCVHCVGLFGAVYEKVKRMLHAILLKRIRTFIAPSRYMQRVVGQNSPYQPVLLYNGFEFSQSQPLQNADTILYSGRLTPDKGVAVLLQAFAELRKKFPKLRLRVAGKGEQGRFLKDQAVDLGISAQTTFLGHLSQSQILEEYHHASTIVVPSIWTENLPTTAIEAISLGRPVVGSNIGGIPEIIDDGRNGLLFSPGDVQDLAEKLQFLFGQPQMLRKCAKQATASAQKFTMANHMRRLMQVYHSLQ